MAVRSCISHEDELIDGGVSKLLRGGSLFARSLVACLCAPEHFSKSLAIDMDYVNTHAKFEPKEGLNAERDFW